ncbi:MAG: S-layer homology domain-containing protein [Tumebacillaceae bacterium]
MTEFVTRGEWAQEVERITGTSQQPVQNPEAFITRVEASVLLADAMPGLNTGIAGNLMPPYRDIDSLDAKQKDAVRYLYHTGIMLGDDDMMFKPYQHLAVKDSKEVAARAQQRLQA